MGNLARQIVTMLVLLAMEESFVFTLPCPSSMNTNNQNSSKDTKCDPVIPMIPAIPDTDEASNGNTTDTAIGSNTAYTLVVALGIVLLPMIVLVRICWLRKLQKQQNNAYNQMRGIMTHRLEEEQLRRNVIFHIDIENVQFEDIFRKPPTYEQSQAHPGIGSPPPYDQNPPPYKYRQGEDSSAVSPNSEHTDQTLERTDAVPFTISHC